MHELHAGILSDEVAARTREREEKIPVEVVLDDGTVAHPSGFVPPTAETCTMGVLATSVACSVEGRTTRRNGQLDTHW